MPHSQNVCALIFVVWALDKNSDLCAVFYFAASYSKDWF